MKGKTKWYFQLCGCFRKGYAAAAAGGTLDDCPYSGRGVNGQRREYWRLGFKRQASGQPID